MSLSFENNENGSKWLREKFSKYQSLSDTVKCQSNLDQRARPCENLRLCSIPAFNYVLTLSKSFIPPFLGLSNFTFLGLNLFESYFLSIEVTQDALREQDQYKGAVYISGAITDRYIDVELHERAKSAAKKKIIKV